jgi:hypothetical protein
MQAHETEHRQCGGEGVGGIGGAEGDVKDWGGVYYAVDCLVVVFSWDNVNILSLDYCKKLEVLTTWFVPVYGVPREFGVSGGVEVGVGVGVGHDGVVEIVEDCCSKFG